MARETVYTDDISGEHGAEPVKVGWNDTWFEVDLAEANRKKLEEFIETYINAGRPVGGFEPARRATRGSGQAQGKRTLTQEEYGEPRRGRVSAEEANYVKSNLEEVNKRLAAKGLRIIDPKDPKHKERYGLQ